MCVCECVCVYHGQVFEDLDPVSWSHVGHMVEVGGVGDQLVPHLGVSQHLPGITHNRSIKNTHRTERHLRVCCLVPLVNYLLCWRRSSSGTLKEKRLLLFMLRTICFLLLSDVSGTTSSSPSGTSQQSVRCVYTSDYKSLQIYSGGWEQHVKLYTVTDVTIAIYQI